MYVIMRNKTKAETFQDRSLVGRSKQGYADFLDSANAA
jgi:hypothetical protein